MEPARAFFSFSRLSDPSHHEAYSQWHQLDHLPENRALPGVMFGERWVRTPRCRAASPRAAFAPSAPAGGIAPGADDFGPDDAQYVTMYWFSDPADEAVAHWNHLAAQSYNWGRRPEIGWTDRWMGFFVPIRGYVHPRVLVSADALVHRPMRGVYVTVSEFGGLNSDVNTAFEWYDRVRIPELLTVPGVAGGWTFASVDSFPGNHGGAAQHQTLRLHIFFLDGDPIEVRAAIDQHATTGFVGSVGGLPPVERPLFDSVLETIEPWRWDWFD